MKKTKVGFLICSLILIVFSVLFIFYKNHTNNSLTEKNKHALSEWNELHKEIYRRMNLLTELAKDCSGKDCDSLNAGILKYGDDLPLYKDECSLQFVEHQYFINELFLNVLDSDSTIIIRKSNMGNKLDLNSDKLNKVITNYNIAVKDFNAYRQRFPHFLVVKRGTFRSKKFFDLKYGIRNQNPVAKRRQAIEMLKKQDSI